MSNIRLDKYICEQFNTTRKEAKEFIKRNKIEINGVFTKDPDFKFDKEIDSVTINGEDIVTKEEHTYILLNKPSGYICANYDAKNRTVFELLPGEYKDFQCVGRLDIDTEGLLLITNDGDFNHRVTSPRHHVDKTYYAKLIKPISVEDIDSVAKGGILYSKDEKPSLPGILKPGEDECSAYITIHEGKFHQVKKMFYALGNEVTYLKRVSFGSITLPDDLKTGSYLLLPENEVLNL